MCETFLIKYLIHEEALIYLPIYPKLIFPQLSKDHPSRDNFSFIQIQAIKHGISVAGILTVQFQNYCKGIRRRLHLPLGITSI